jgi:ABC-2 type transport system permease protein
MRRKGSAFQGLGTVMLKELADNLSSLRMRILEWLVILVAAGVLYFTVKLLIRTSTDHVLLKMFTVSGPVAGRQGPSLVSILGFLLPLVAIGLGFDSINSEHARRTLSRILAQPLYRDALLAGKFLAGLVTLGISLLTLWLLVVGLSLLFLGVPPTGEDIARSLVFMVITLGFAGVWLGLAILLSVIFRSSATAALVALGLWLFLTVLWPVFITPAVAQVFATPDPIYAALGLPDPSYYLWQSALDRLSPATLFTESVSAVLDPSVRVFGLVSLEQLQGAVPGNLPLLQSILLVWPQAVGLVAGVIVLFVASYVVFQRQEIRA